MYMTVTSYRKNEFLGIAVCNASQCKSMQVNANSNLFQTTVIIKGSNSKIYKLVLKLLLSFVIIRNKPDLYA